MAEAVRAVLALVAPARGRRGRGTAGGCAGVAVAVFEGGDSLDRSSVLGKTDPLDLDMALSLCTVYCWVVNKVQKL